MSEVFRNKESDQKEKLSTVTSQRKETLLLILHGEEAFKWDLNSMDRTSNCGNQSVC